MKFYKKFILSLVFLGTLLSSFHYHADGQSSDNCQICILQHNISSADIPHSFSLPSLDFKFKTLYGYVNASFIYKLTKDSLSRAPPYFS
jgi:hypothetical protein